MTPSRYVKYYYLRYKRLNGNPRSLALGSAIGAILGIMPIMPLRTVVIIASTALIRANTIAALIVATIIANPVTIVALYYFALVAGNFLTAYTLNWERVKIALDILTSNTGFTTSMKALASLGFEAFAILMVGGMTLAIPVSLITYTISFRFFSSRGAAKKQNAG
jgi:uncharacterized protein (DUF2062 family)